MMRTVDYIADRIAKECANHVFGVTGRGILYLTDAVAKHPDLEFVAVHHEQAAAFAASSYGEYTRKPGACLVSTGCASTNAMTGLLCAYQDGVPCVFLSGNNFLKETVGYTKLPVRTFGSQETDIIPVVKPLTKYAVMITDAKKIAYEIDKAIYLANSGVKGPVWIDVPLDIQSALIEPDELERYTPDDDIRVASDDDIRYIADAFAKAERPAILIGSGAKFSGSEAELKSFVEDIGIPLVYAHSAVDVYPADNELSIGTVGAMYGTRAGNFTVQNADLVLVLGCRLTSMTTGSNKEKFVREGKIIVVDINPDEFTKDTANIDRIVAADVKDTLVKLSKVNIKRTSGSWREKCLHWKNTFPRCEQKYKQSKETDLFYLAEVLSETLPDESVVLCDAGIEELILPSNIVFKQGMRCMHPTMQGSMGYALPASIGAYFSSGKPVCAIIGDGSVLMNLQEFITLQHNNIPLKLIIVNNNMYSVIRKRQKELFRTRTIGIDPQNGVGTVNFEKIADCFGFDYMRVEDSTTLECKLNEMFSNDNAVLCEVIGVENQEYMSEGYTKTADKRYTRRPIEDQAPFIDRDVFLREMIVTPIDQ